MFDYIGVFDITGYSSLVQCIIIYTALLVWEFGFVGPLLFYVARSADQTLTALEKANVGQKPNTTPVDAGTEVAH